MEQDNTYIRFDWAMKHMLRDKANFGILEGLISVLLGEDVKIVELLESESGSVWYDDSSNRLDIMARNSNGQLIIVEIQLVRQLHYLYRKYYGKCKVITKHAYSSVKYGQVKKVYSINILFCDFGYGDDYIYHGETGFYFKGMNTGNFLRVDIKENGVIVAHLPLEMSPEYYVIRIKAYDKRPDTPHDEWIKYLKTGKVAENTRTPGLQEVCEKLQPLMMTLKESREYDDYMDTIMVQNDVLDTARDEGFAKGYAEGLAESQERVGR